LNKKEKQIIRLTAASHFMVHLFEGVLPPLFPLLIQEFGTDYFHLGLIVTVFSYAFGVGSLPAGHLSDKISPGRLITWFLFGAGILAVLVGYMSSLAGYGILMAGIGLFCSIYHPTSNTLISLDIHEKGTAFGIHGIAGSIGVAMVPLLSAWIGTLLGWRIPHVLFGVMSILAAIYSLAIYRQTDSGKKENGKRRDQMASPFPFFNLVIFFLSATAPGLIYKGIMTFLPVYMGERINIDSLQLGKVTLGGTVATVALLSGALGQYVAGRAVDRYQAERLYLGTVILGTVFVLLMAVSDNLILLFSSIMYAFFHFATQPIQNYLLSTYVPEHRQGLIYGIHFFITFGIGSTAAAVCGYFADHYGLQSVFYSMALCFIFAGIMALMLLMRVNRYGKKIEGKLPVKFVL